MELISQHAKKIMEDCKKIAKAAGLVINTETIEYIVTNQDMLELSPKVMIPTLYDLWINDIGVHQGKGFYKVYPSNAYETVINTRPAISFYNDNNPDWLNVMIFYHVLGHVDFFQNNFFYKRTWNEDFCGKALSDKRLIDNIRREKGKDKRWVDYVIEFFRTVDNLVAFYPELEEKHISSGLSKKVDFYFGDFLEKKKGGVKVFYDELERYNKSVVELGEKQGENAFFADSEFRSKYPEFEAVFLKYQKKKKKEKTTRDVMQFIMEHSPFIKKDGNEWMKQVGEVVRETSLYFQPQIRTKTVNEGWASYWHQELFTKDKRVGGHEVDFARIDSFVTSVPRVGKNPYAIGLRLLQFIEELADKGKLSQEFQLIKNRQERKSYNQKTGKGKEALFDVRRNFDDFMLFNFLPPDEFQDFVDKHNLVVVDRVLNQKKWKWDYYIKSKIEEDYRKKMIDSLYHPAQITIDETRTSADGGLHLYHFFEGKQLITEHIPHVLEALEYLWCGPGGGAPITLNMIEFEGNKDHHWRKIWDPDFESDYKKKRTIYKRQNGAFSSSSKVISTGVKGGTK